MRQAAPASGLQPAGSARVRRGGETSRLTAREETMRRRCERWCLRSVTSPRFDRCLLAALALHAWVFAFSDHPTRSELSNGSSISSRTIDGYSSASRTPRPTRPPRRRAEHIRWTSGGRRRRRARESLSLRARSQAPPPPPKRPPGAPGRHRRLIPQGGAESARSASASALPRAA